MPGSGVLQSRMPEEGLENTQVSRPHSTSLSYSPRYLWRRLPCSKSGGFLKEIRRLDRAKAAQHEAHSMPPFEQRMALFEDFLKAHSFLLTRAREAAVCGVKGGPDSFDFNNTYLLVALSYRVDCEGNPARAFRVECVDLVRYNQEKYNAATHKALEAGRARLDALCGARSLGSLRIMYRTAERHSEEDLRKWDVQPVFKPAWQAQKLNVPRLPNPHRMCIDRYYSELVSATEHGLVLRHDAEAGRCVIGELVKSGTQWRWEQLTPAQLLERGLPAGFNDLMYDLVSPGNHRVECPHIVTHHLANALEMVVRPMTPFPTPSFSCICHVEPGDCLSTYTSSITMCYTIQSTI